MQIDLTFFQLPFANQKINTYNYYVCIFLSFQLLFILFCMFPIYTSSRGMMGDWNLCLPTDGIQEIT